MRERVIELRNGFVFYSTKLKLCHMGVNVGGQMKFGVSRVANLPTPLSQRSQRSGALRWFGLVPSDFAYLFSAVAPRRGLLLALTRDVVPG